MGYEKLPLEEGQEQTNPTTWGGPGVDAAFTPVTGVALLSQQLGDVELGTAQQGYPYSGPAAGCFFPGCATGIAGCDYEDEKLKIRGDDGLCTIVPALQTRAFNSSAAVGLIMLSTFGALFVILAIFLTPILPAMGVIFWCMAAVVFGGGIGMYVAARRSNSAKEHTRIEEQLVEEFVAEVTKTGATMPQISAVAWLMRRADPDTPHEFHAWKMTHPDEPDMHNHCTNIIRARFGCLKGQKVQMHLYQLA